MPGHEAEVVAEHLRVELVERPAASPGLELLREVLPGLRRLAILANVGDPNTAREIGEVEAAARTLGLSVVQVKVIVGALAAFVAAVGGGFIALDARVAQPESYETFLGLVWLAVDAARGCEVDVAVHHLAAADRAVTITEQVSAGLGGKVRSLFTSEVGPVLGAHVGPGLVGVVVRRYPETAA